MSCADLSTLIGLLAGSLMRESSRDLLYGTITWVSRDDLAAVAVVLITSGHDGASYEITGSHALTLAEAAEEFSCHRSPDLLSSRNPRGGQSVAGEV